MDRAEKSGAETYAHLKGFSGWLVIFIILMGMGVINKIFLIGAAPELIQKLVAAFLAIALGYGVYGTVMSEPYTPAYWTVVLTTLGLLSLALSDWKAALPSLIWLLYWQRSKRVLVTYGTTGFGGRFGIGKRLSIEAQEAQTPP